MYKNKQKMITSVLITYLTVLTEKLNNELKTEEFLESIAGIKLQRRMSFVHKDWKIPDTILTMIGNIIYLKETFHELTKMLDIESKYVQSVVQSLSLSFFVFFACFVFLFFLFFF